MFTIQSNNLKSLLPLIAILVLVACSQEQDIVQKIDSIRNDSLAQISKDSIAKAKYIAEYENRFDTVNYLTTVIEDKAHLLQLKSDWKWLKNDPIPNKIFITLNRKEMIYLRVGDTIVVPDSVIHDVRAYSIFPQYYANAESVEKLIVVSNKYQCYACYEKGELVRFAACNTGKEKTPTFPGRYALTWQELERRSSLDSNWVMPYTWNFHPFAGNAFHQFAMPGRPVSHSCVRQFLSDAKWLYSWGKREKRDTAKQPIPYSGTPVIILDVFDFTRKKFGPWLDITNNYFRIDNLPSAPMQVDEALIPYCQIPLSSRWRFADNNKFKYAEDTLRARGIIREGVKLIESVNFNEKRRKDKARKARLKKIEEEKKKAEMNSADSLNSEVTADSLNIEKE